MESIGEKIRNLRKQAGMTQSQLADIMGVKTDAISKWESGRVKNIPAKKIRKMASYFKVSLEYLMPGIYDYDDEVRLGDRLYELRQQANLTQSEVANKAGIKERRYCNIEEGTGVPTIEELTKIFGSFGVEDITPFLPHPDCEYYAAGIEYARTHLEGNNTGQMPEEGEDHDSYSEAERNLIKVFDSLNNDGKAIAIERLQELSEIPRFRTQ